MTSHLPRLDVAYTWLSRCLPQEEAALMSVLDRSGRGGGQVMECQLETEPRPLVLKVYSPGMEDYSQLGPVGLARKHALALRELGELGVPTPRVLGFASIEDEAALAMEKVEAQPWTATTRSEAARVLARLHSIGISKLSDELADLVRRSTPNRGRVGEAPEEPPLTEMTLQHGDYFSVNLMLSPDGLRVADWDLFALGDPMWDLGFLLGADRGVPEAEAEAVIAAYEETRRIDEKRLAWQRRCWEVFWSERGAVA